MKFFKFIRDNISPGSVTASDTGVGISVVAIPAQNVSLISASTGKVKIVFKDSSIYDDVQLFENEAIEKTSVEISCKIGDEISLISDIINFIGSEQKNKQIIFNSVQGTSTFQRAVVDSKDDLAISIKESPINVETGEKSQGSEERKYQNSIGEINFGREENLPSFDLNHQGLVDFADGATITTWINSGTGGSTYNTPRLGSTTPTCEDDPATSGIRTKSVRIQNTDAFNVPAYTAKGDYTLYCVFGEYTGDGGYSNPMVLYGDEDGETIGFGGIHAEVADFNEVTLGKARKKYSFSVRHDGRLGVPATTQTDTKENGTVAFKWPSYLEANGSIDEMGGPDVFIIRRDSKNNMYLHNRDGDLVAFINGKTITDNKVFSNKTPGLTDGDLLIENIGTIKDFTTAASIVFAGHLARFGVIERDIGASASSSLAKDLFNLYKTI